MAKASSKSSANTELYIGTLMAAVGLFGTQAKPEKTAEFDTAGPNGGVLRYEQRAVEKPVEDQAPADLAGVPVVGDPLGGDGDAMAAVAESGAAYSSPPVPATGTVEGGFRQVLVEEGTGVEVAPEDVRKGVRIEGGFVDCTEQLDAIVARTKLDRIEVVRCIDSTQIRRERVVGAYYIGATDEKSPVVLRLLYEALRARREVAVVKYTTRSRQQLGVIAPHVKTGTLVLLSLVFSDDWREPPAKALTIARAEVRSVQVEAMAELLRLMHGTVEDVDALRDDAVALREELKMRALAGEMAAVVEAPVEAVEEPIEDALAASLLAVRAGKV